jgi:hypothetical protein
MGNCKFLFVLMGLCILSGCRKKIDSGTTIKVSGSAFDHIKNKSLPNVKLFLYGAKSTFYGISYTLGPFDSVVTDNAGNFVLQYKAEGQSVDYALSLANNAQYDFGYTNSTNYIHDETEPLLKFNYATTLNNVKVRGRELHYTIVHLKVDANPFDSFQVRTWSTGIPKLIIGQQIDQTVVLRHLPHQQNIIEYYTEAVRDTAGLAQLNAGLPVPKYSIRRVLRDTIVADMADSIFISKNISNSLSIPRGQ